MSSKGSLPPFALPIIFFALVIGLGTLFLHSRFCLAQASISWTDALFTATSATCVTGLAVVDTGTFFSRAGQVIILVLIQVGGLGIMTFTSLAFYLWRRRVSFTDRLAVGQSLLHDPAFHLGKFLQQIVAWTFFLEGVGALLLFLRDPAAFTPFSAVFHSVSAFCNAGFSLFGDSLSAWRQDLGVNLVFIALITLGGLGFSVLIELRQLLAPRGRGKAGAPRRMSWYTRTVLNTSLFLVLAGWVAIFLGEQFGQGDLNGGTLLAGLFQSVSCRTAGFNTVDIGRMTNISLLFMIMLMFIGGAPGSCAGGIKVTTFRALLAFGSAQLKGARQSYIRNYALSRDSLNKAMTLGVFGVAIILGAVLLLNITEGGDLPHPETRGLFLEILFEAVSAFGTVGLSTGLTPTLSTAGKYIITGLMFTGRLGPLVFLAALQGFQKVERFSRPEENMLIG